MKSLFLASAIAFAMTFSVTSSAAEQLKANQEIPVFYQANAKTPVVPVFAQKDGKYYQVVTYPTTGAQPFFRVSANEWHFVNGDDQEFPVYFMSSPSATPTALPSGMSDEARDTLLAGKAEVKDQLVHWFRRGWYGYRYNYYPRYNYYYSNNYYYNANYYYPSYNYAYPTYWYYPSYSYGYGYNNYYGGYGCTIGGNYDGGYNHYGPY